MKDIIFIPTYNERENIRTIIPKIFTLVPEAHIVVVDDNSPDGTSDEVLRLMELHPNLSLLSRPRKEGLGAAYKDALQKVLGDPDVFSVTMMDADGSHDPKYLQLLFEEIRKNDLVIGSRYVSGGRTENCKWRRIALSRCANFYARIFTGLSIKDVTNGFICIKKDTLEKIEFSKLQASGYSFLIELKFYSVKVPGTKWKEIPILFKNRREGESKMSGRIMREGLKTPIRIFLQRFGGN